MNMSIAWGEYAALTQRGGFRRFNAPAQTAPDYDAEPSTATHPGSLALDAFAAVIREAIELAASLSEEGEFAPINRQTYEYAIKSLLPLVGAFALPAPLLLPLENGGIGAEWHDRGLNIELRFRAPYDVYAVIEDARGTVEPLHGRDNNLAKAQTALGEFAHRGRT